MATTKVTTGGITDATIATADIADQAVTLAKLEHGTPSNDGKFLRANNGADPSFESIPVGTTINNNADNRVITGSGSANTLNGESGFTYNGSTLGLTGGIIATGEINTPNNIQISADNKQFIFGASDDGRIYHDGSNSYFTNATGYLFIQGNDVAIRSAAGSNRIIASGQAVDLFYGTSGKLSTISTGVNINGGIRLGGNNAANELDDYEEGTWTAALSNGETCTSSVARYTKIGCLVTVYAYINSFSDFNGNNNNFKITGLPFTSRNVSSYHGGGSISYAHNFNYSYPLLPLIGTNSSHIYFHRQDGTTAAWKYQDFHNTGNGSGGQLIIQFTYETDS
tara:strand:- start:197 stop:1213 length:1017 start_codon:yes stop_codon:yes gene_type:complete